MILVRLEDDEDYDTDDLIQRGKGGGGGDGTNAAASSRLQALADMLTSLEEYSQEKRTVQREAMLRRLFKGLTLSAGTVAYELVASASASILRACQWSLRLSGGSTTATEQYAACRVLEATSIALGANEEEWVESLEDVLLLRRIVQSTARATPVRVAALRAWSLAVVICTAFDVVRVTALQDMCQALALEQAATTTSALVVPVALRVAALDCWALLATLLDDGDLVGQDDEGQVGRGCAALPKLYTCLMEDSAPNGSSSNAVESMVELRSAAGECLALIHEARVNLGVLDNCDTTDNTVEPETASAVDDDSEAMIVVVSSVNNARNHSNGNATTRRFGKGSWDGSAWEGVMDDVKQRVAELSTESGHYLRKKIKKEQRATFREYRATLLDDESPEVVVNFNNGASLTLSSWKEVIPLNFIRHALQGGFQMQMQRNPTLVSMFDSATSVSHNAATSSLGMSTLEKRLILSKASEAYKTADQDRRGKRDKRENIKNHFLTADGEDI
jgi:Interferon-related developmental regulator (IFRD)